MIDRLVKSIDRHRLVRNCAAIVDVAAPTGYERPCAEQIVELLAEAGLAGELLSLDERSANVICRIPARGPAAGSGKTVMFYSPIDTVTTGGVADDVPQVADIIDGHLLPKATISADGTMVSGLGAQNPKGHAACVLELAAVLANSDTDLSGDIVVAFGAGGMPTFSLDGDDRADTGHGVGVAAIIDHLRRTGSVPDAAVEAKTGWFVQNEEVGLAWTDITVRGTHTYVGARHRLPYRNAVADGARVVLALEEHFETTAGERSTDTLEPQAMVASFHGGWNRMAAFTPAAIRIRVDQRLLPGESGAEANNRVNAVLDRLRAEDGQFEADAELVLEIAGSHTDADHWICRSGRAAWEQMEGRPHPLPERQSGSTDANIIRNAGIATIRVGLPKVHIDGAELGFAEGMNTVDAAAMAKLTELLLRTVPSVGDGETIEKLEIG